MKKLRSCALALACLCASVAAPAATIVEDFSTNPLEKGWRVFGNTSQFYWNSTNHTLEVTWDSTQSNSYFYQPVNGYLTRHDDFGFEFDLTLKDIASGVEAGKTGPLQIGIGFLNLAGATGSEFKRGIYGSSPNVAGFDYYPWGYYDYFGTIYDAPAATVPSFISEEGYNYAPGLVAPYNCELPTNQPVHVSLYYTGDNQTAILTVTTNGVPLSQMPPLVLEAGNNFESGVDFRVDAFSISSYSSAGDEFNSVLGHGALSNIRVVLPPPTGELGLAFTNGAWQVSFANRTNWVYTLERGTEPGTWTAASAPVEGTGTAMTLTDTNTPASRAFYRVRATRP